MTKYVNKENYVIYDNDLKYSESLEDFKKKELYNK